MTGGFDAAQEIVIPEPLSPTYKQLGGETVGIGAGAGVGVGVGVEAGAIVREMGGQRLLLPTPSVAAAEKM